MGEGRRLIDVVSECSLVNRTSQTKMFTQFLDRSPSNQERSTDDFYFGIHGEHQPRHRKLSAGASGCVVGGAGAASQPIIYMSLGDKN